MDIKLTKLLFALVLISSFFLQQKKDGTVTLEENKTPQVLPADIDYAKKKEVPLALGGVADFPKY